MSRCGCLRVVDAIVKTHKDGQPSQVRALTRLSDVRGVREYALIMLVCNKF